jgi:hypothetical protein
MIRQVLARHQAGDGPGFRWRSHRITRIAGFSDAALAGWTYALVGPVLAAHGTLSGRACTIHRHHGGAPP